MRWNVVRIGFLLCIFSGESVYGQSDATLELQAKALQVIRDAARDVCNSVPISGTGQNLELTGNAKAKIDGVIKNVLDVGIEGAGKYQSGEYNNVLQKDLAQAIKTNSDCKQAVLNTLVDRMIPARFSPNDQVSPTRPKGSSLHSIRHAFQDRDAIIVEITVPKPRSPRDEEFLSTVGETVSFTTAGYDPVSGRGSIESTSFGVPYGGRIAVSDTSLTIANASGYGCWGLFRLVESGALYGKLSCKWYGTVYPTYNATINLGGMQAPMNQGSPSQSSIERGYYAGDKQDYRSPSPADPRRESISDGYIGSSSVMPGVSVTPGQGCQPAVAYNPMTGRTSPIGNLPPC